MRKERRMLEMEVHARLFHDTIRNVADFDFAIYGKIAVSNRAIPNIMIALAPSHKIAVMLLQYLANLFFIFRHLLP